jgi:GGDEF domain-containing protein
MFGRLSLTKTGLALLAASVAYCGTILFIDIRTASEFSEAFLYSLALILIYPVRRPWAIWFVTVMGISFTVFGKLFEEEVEAGIGGLFNRGMASFMLVAFAILLQRITTVERVLFRLSTYDPLTGALNRRQFMALLSREQKRAERYAARFSLLMIDIDHFKKINDTYGHQIGDVAIKRMAESCQQHLRPTDLFCRYGGEEFLVAGRRRAHPRGGGPGRDRGRGQDGALYNQRRGGVLRAAGAGRAADRMRRPGALRRQDGRPQSGPGRASRPADRAATGGRLGLRPQRGRGRSPASAKQTSAAGGDPPR